MPAQKVEYKIGCDPEMFVVNDRGEPVSAHNLLPGNKLYPREVTHGAVQVDGTAAEFNIDPATGSSEFSRNIQTVLRQMTAMIRSGNPQFRLKAMPVAHFAPEYFNSLPAEALMFGCEPDFQAWDSGHQQDFAGTEKPMRTGAGHVHVGWTADEGAFDQAHFFDCIQATKQLDATLFFASLLWDSDNERREVYGKMGSFRPKTYGVEYRPLSNAWIGDRLLHVFVFRCTEWAMNLLDFHGVELWDSDELSDTIRLYQNNHRLSRDGLVDLHLSLHNKYGMPKLPEKYLARVTDGSDSHNSLVVLGVDAAGDDLALGGATPETAAQAILG